MRIYLAGAANKRWPISEEIKKIIGKEVFCPDDLEMSQPWPRQIEIPVLESFFRITKWTRALIPHLKWFMLDSGAFTFFTQGKAVDWNKYIDAYGNFVKEYGVKYYLELDIDSIVGYKKVLELRSRLEAIVGRPCIPVWHRSRGKEEFLKMCDEYKYVAVGGFATKEITKKEYGAIIPWLIRQAHKRGAKIHGLGFTDVKSLGQYHFDSVDSSSWTVGSRFGHYYQFDGDGGFTQRGHYGSCRGHNVKRLEAYNFRAWVEFQKYAERKL